MFPNTNRFSTLATALPWGVDEDRGGVGLTVSTPKSVPALALAINSSDNGMNTKDKGSMGVNVHSAAPSPLPDTGPSSWNRLDSSSGFQPANATPILSGTTNQAVTVQATAPDSVSSSQVAESHTFSREHVINSPETSASAYDQVNRRYAHIPWATPDGNPSVPFRLPALYSIYQQHMPGALRQNSISTNGDAKNGGVHESSQNATPESVIRDMRMGFTVDPITIIHQGYLPVLGTDNWLDWAQPMQLYLKLEGLWSTWDSSNKYAECPEKQTHSMNKGKYNKCPYYECDRRDRVDALSLLLIYLTCDEANKILVLNQPTARDAWRLLERVYVYGAQEDNRDFESLHPVSMMERGCVRPLEGGSIADFLVRAYKQWLFYCCALETHGGTQYDQLNLARGEQAFLIGVIGLLADAQYRWIKEHWLPRLADGPIDFHTVYGWVLAKEREHTVQNWG